MGNYISNNAVYRSAKRVIMRYNVENRAFKEIERQTNKPVVAPKHDAGIIDYHESLKANTEYLAKTTVVHTDLDKRLKDVYVTSKGLTENITTDKALPLQRSTEVFDIGYKDSDRVPRGRVSLMQAIHFIDNHQKNANEWTIERIAEENKIKPEVASDIIQFYKVFDVYMSKKLKQGDLQKIGSNLKLLGAKNSES